MKFKNIKQKRRKSAPPIRKSVKKGAGDSGKTPQFPNIYRIITERLAIIKSPKLTIRLPLQSKLNNIIILILVLISVSISVILIVGIAIFGLKTYGNLSSVVETVNQRQMLQGQVNFWQSVADKFDGYKDAYFQKALLEYRLHEIQQAKQDNLKALLLDPNFEDARKLETVLDKAY